MTVSHPESLEDCQAMMAALNNFLTRQRHDFVCACHQCQAHENVNDAYWHLNRQMEERKRA